MPAVDDIQVHIVCLVVHCIWNGSLLRYGNLYVVSKGMLPRFQLGFLLANRTWKFSEKKPFISTRTKTRCDCNDFVRYQDE